MEVGQWMYTDNMVFSLASVLWWLDLHGTQDGKKSQKNFFGSFWFIDLPSYISDICQTDY